jgi:hypothetical protein
MPRLSLDRRRVKPLIEIGSISPSAKVDPAENWLNEGI